MAFGLGATDRQFLEDAQAFISRHWRRPVGARSDRVRAGTTPEIRAWFDALVAQGWSVPQWPVEYGGTGWSPSRRYLWARELALAEAPLLDPIGLRWAGPAICAWGTAAQRARLLPGIREARERWCLGFADPETSTDRAGLPTHLRIPMTGDARTDGGTYLIDGLLSRVRGAQGARWMMALVHAANAAAAAADAAQSLLVVDMTAPGVTVEPMRMLDGTSGVCRVRFERVAVPARWRLGADGRGGGLAHTLTAMAGRQFDPAAALSIQADKLAAAAAELPGDTGPLADDPAFARKLAELGVELAGLEALEVRYVGRWERGGEREIVPTAGELAVLQLWRTRVAQRIGELFVEAFGYYSLPYPDPRAVDNEGPIGHDYALAALQGMLAGRSISIDGGSSESLRDRIANELTGSG